MTICDISPAIMENQENKRSKIQYPPPPPSFRAVLLFMNVHACPKYLNTHFFREIQQYLSPQQGFVQDQPGLQDSSLTDNTGMLLLPPCSEYIYILSVCRSLS